MEDFQRNIRSSFSWLSLHEFSVTTKRTDVKKTLRGRKPKYFLLLFALFGRIYSSETKIFTAWNPKY